jgi:hypothetical protein
LLWRRRRKKLKGAQVDEEKNNYSQLASIDYLAC